MNSLPVNQLFKLFHSAIARFSKWKPLVIILVFSLQTFRVSSQSVLTGYQVNNIPAQPTDSIRFSDVAVSRTLPAGAPKYSDVSFSTRSKNPGGMISIDTAAAFHATRVDWVYSIDTAWIHQIISKGYAFNGALNTLITDNPSTNHRWMGRIYNSSGQKIHASWMTTGTPPVPDTTLNWGCVNSTEYRSIYLAQAKRIIDAGATSLQMDDPGMNIELLSLGACHCSYCQAKATALGTTVDKIQTQSVIDFFTDMRDSINNYVHHTFPFSSNNFRGLWVVPTSSFDFGMAEFQATEANAATIYSRLKDAEVMGKSQLFTLTTDSVKLNRIVIATTYACGGMTIAPWDVYLVNTPSSRYYGKTYQYADLYGFIRANKKLLDGYEDANISGPGLSDSRYTHAPVVISGGTGKAYAFTRAKPGQPDSTIVIHLVDWAGTPASFTLSVDINQFPSGSSPTFYIVTPKTYNAVDHQNAESTQNYSTLINRVAITPTVVGATYQFAIPALAPYALIEAIP